MATKPKSEVFSINLPFEQTKTSFIIMNLKQVFHKCFSFYSVFKLQLLSVLLAAPTDTMFIIGIFAKTSHSQWSQKTKVEKLDVKARMEADLT